MTSPDLVDRATAHAASRAEREPRRRRRLRAVVPAMVAIAAAAGAAALILWRMAPPAYREHQAFLASQDPALLDVAIGRVEAQCRRVLEAASARADGTGRLILDRLDANLWLSRAADGFAQRHGLILPAHVHDLMLDAEGGRPVLRFHLRTDETDQVLSIAARPVFASDGTLSLRDVAVQAGRLPVPLAALRGVLRKSAVDQHKESIDRLGTLFDGCPFEPLLTAADGAGVLLTGLEVNVGRIALGLRILPADRRHAAAAPTR